MVSSMKKRSITQLCLLLAIGLFISAAVSVLVLGGYLVEIFSMLPPPASDPNLIVFPLFFFIIYLIFAIIFYIFFYRRYHAKNQRYRIYPDAIPARTYLFTIVISILLLIPMISLTFFVKPFPLDGYFFIKVINNGNKNVSATIIVDSIDEYRYTVAAKSGDSDQISGITFEEHRFDFQIPELNYSYSIKKYIDYNLDLFVFINNTEGVNISFNEAALL